MDLDTLFKLLEKNPGLSITFESHEEFDVVIVNVKKCNGDDTKELSMSMSKYMSVMSPGFRDAYILKTIESVLEENKGEQEGEWL